MPLVAGHCRYAWVSEWTSFTDSSERNWYRTCHVRGLCSQQTEPLHHRLFSKYDGRKREQILSHKIFDISCNAWSISSYERSHVLVVISYMWPETHKGFLIWPNFSITVLGYWRILFKDISEFSFQWGSTFEKSVSFSQNFHDSLVSDLCSSVREVSGCMESHF